MQVGAFQNASILNSKKYLEFHNWLRYLQTFGFQYKFCIYIFAFQKDL